MNRIRGSLVGWVSRCVFFLFLFCLAGLACLAPPSPFAQVRRVTVPGQLARPVAGESADGFVTYQNKGGTAVRQMAGHEMRSLQASQQKVQFHALSGHQATASPGKVAQQGFFNLHATPQLEGFPQAKAAFLRAAARWSEIVLLETYVEVNIDFGPTLFGALFASPNTVAATVAQTLTLTSPGPALPELLAGNAASEQQAAVFNALPAPFTETDLGRTNSYRLTIPQGQALGFLLPATLPPHTLGINSNISFDFDPRDGVDAGKVDFEALVLRELGHVLGFISAAGYQELTPTEPTRPTVWDLFRFRPGVNPDSIATGLRVQSSGGEQVFYAGTKILPLSTGRPDGTGGDGRPAAHWKDNALTGQYSGIMDPTYAAGERGVITFNDLLALSYLGHKLTYDAAVAEVLSPAGASQEETVSPGGALVANRFNPAHLPFKLEAVRISLPVAADRSSPTGSPLRIVAWIDPLRTGRPPGNGTSAPSFLLDRTITIPALPDSRLLEVMFPEALSFGGSNSGDLYIGVQSPNANVRIGADRGGVRQGVSFISTDNGLSFRPLQNAGQVLLNLNLQAVVVSPFNADNNLAPTVEAVSPVSAVPGGQDFTLHVFGKGFFPETRDSRGFVFNSVVLWNGEVRGTGFVSSDLLLASISAKDIAAAGTARVTVFTPTQNGDLESLPLEFSITPNRPAPRLASLEPGQGITGSASLKLRVLGADFTSGSMVRWNGADRPTTMVNSVELFANLSAADLADSGNAEITVFTPGPGGGTSRPMAFAVAPCSYTLSQPIQSFRTRTFNEISIRQGGVIVTPSGACPWTAHSNVPWITNLQPASGTSKTPITFRILNNPGPERIGTVTIGNATMTIRQNGFATSVSAASYAELIAPDSIVSIFGAGLANATEVATSTPLPVKLAGATAQLTRRDGSSYPAQLFFASPQQINLLVPANLPVLEAPFPDDYLLSVLVNGQFVAEGIVSVAAIAPAFFTADATGKGLPAAVVFRVKADGTQSFEPVADFDAAQNRFIPRPIDLGAETDRVFMLLFGTGLRGRTALDSVKIKIGGLDVPALFAAAQGDFAGLDQINLQLPRSLKGRGQVTINCSVDTRSANPVTVTIR
jgi:uncharacterized protein (TIGR03437 family)